MREISRHRGRFELLHKVYKVRDFKLELHVDVLEPGREYAVKALKEAVAAERARGAFNDSFPEPPVISFSHGQSQEIGYKYFDV